jgi:signal transduction histidine kinase
MNKASCGLGLVISKALSIELGGNIIVESEVDKGSIFSVLIKEED